MTAPFVPIDDTAQFLLSRVNYERTHHLPYHSRSFGLERMRRLLQLLGDPHESFPAVHVAGTKGKGSTATMIASVLSRAGYRTALYTSPHLSGVEERMRIDGVVCSPSRLVQLVSEARAAIEQLDREAEAAGRAGDGPTYFEITTALAMKYFVEENVDIAVLEVGLGGRLDSTNVCRPLVSVITSIGFDHMAQLGNTLASIAGEKAGIIKPGIPVVTGVTEDEPLGVITQVAQRQGSPLLRAGAESAYELQLGMLGRHQAANAAVALASLRELMRQGWAIAESAIQEGFRSATCPARIEIIGQRPLVILDVAHNLCSVEALLSTLGEHFPAVRRSLLFASSRDKDVAGMLQRLLPSFQQVCFTRYQKNPRAADLAMLAELAGGIDGRLTPLLIDDPLLAWQTVYDQCQPGDLLCVTGSFFLAAELRQQMQTDCAGSRTPIGAAG